MTWLKNNHSLLQTQTNVLSSGNGYNVTSSVLVPLESSDILSSVLCRVEHKLSVVFQKVITLDQYLRGKTFLFLEKVIPRWAAGCSWCQFISGEMALLGGDTRICDVLHAMLCIEVAFAVVVTTRINSESLSSSEKQIECLPSGIWL